MYRQKKIPCYSTLLLLSTVVGVVKGVVKGVAISYVHTLVLVLTAQVNLKTISWRVLIK